jgi:hypothetical protein
MGALYRNIGHQQVVLMQQLEWSMIAILLHDYAAA